MNKLTKCAVCGGKIQYLSNQSREVPFKTDFKVKYFLVNGISYTKCINLDCGEIFYSPDDLKLEKNLVREALAQDRKKRGLLTAEEIKQIRENLQLSQAEFSKLLGVGANNIAKYESYRSDQNTSMDMLLRAIKIYGLELIEKINQDAQVA